MCRLGGIELDRLDNLRITLYIIYYLLKYVLAISIFIGNKNSLHI